MGILFGTDGVRGIANVELDCVLAYKLGQAGAYVLAKRESHRPTILVGKDTRLSGDMLESALVSGILSVGANVVTLGVIPTPAVAYLTKKYNADAGVVISASHNPYNFNGIKFFSKDGYKLPDELEDEIEDIILNKKEGLFNLNDKDIGKKFVKDDCTYDYVDFITSCVNVKFHGLKIALDCANGASFKAAPLAFKKLGAEVLPINVDPDGRNINEKCGSTYLDALSKFVVENKCDLGLAFDGDADRLLAVDENGEIVDGDKILSIFANYFKKKGLLKDNTLVATVMSNLGLFKMGQECGIKILQTKVGDRYVLEEMLKGGYTLGGEQSGHIILLDHNTTGDGLLTGVMLVSILVEEGKKLSGLAKIMKCYPQVLVNAKVKNKDGWDKDEEILQGIKNLEEKYKESGRVLIRPSGTEPLIRVMIEGENQKEIEKDANDLAKLIQEKLG